MAQVLGIADVFSFAVWPETAIRLFPTGHVRQVGPDWALVRRHWQWFLPVMPTAWRHVDLSSYDIVLTSAHACVNSVRPAPDALLVSYCHTPMRYAWEWESESKRLPAPLRPIWPPIAARLRAADKSWAQRVDLFLANSHCVADRIRTSYGRGALVVHPPIDTAFWHPEPATQPGGYFLLSGRMVAYKRPDVVVDAAAEAGVDLIVAGDGPLIPALRKRASRTTRFELNPSNERLRDLYRGARALVFAGTEDFGMSLVEAQACGTPVIAYAAGGALESIAPGVSGVLLQDGSVRSFASAMRSFHREEFDAAAVRATAQRFDAGRFDETMRWAMDRAYGRDWQAINMHPAWVEPPT